MNRKSLYFALPVASLMITIVPLFAAPEQSSSPSASEQRAMTILKNLSQYLAQTQHFSVTIREGYDAVQESGQKVEFGEIRKLTVSRPDRLRIEAERSDGEKNLVFFNGKELTVYTPDKNVYATVSKQGTLDEVIHYAIEDLKIRVPLAMLLLSTLPSEVDKLVVSADYVEKTTIMEVPCDHVAARTAKATTVYGAGKNYIYNNGVFYDPAGEGFEIVDPPPGMLVPSIPSGAATVTVNGANYREFAGVWYRPFYSGSDVVYQTVANPVG